MHGEDIPVLSQAGIWLELGNFRNLEIWTCLWLRNLLFVIVDLNAVDDPFVQTKSDSSVHVAYETVFAYLLLNGLGLSLQNTGKSYLAYYVTLQ